MENREFNLVLAFLDGFNIESFDLPAGDRACDLLVRHVWRCAT